MAKDLLDGVNEVFKKTNVLDSDTGVLTSLSDSGRQTQIDIAIQSINEALDDLYDLPELSKPKQMREATITLADGVKSHSLHSKSVMLRREYHLIDETNNHIIHLLDERGYRQQIFGDLDQDDTGLPSSAAISPVDGRLYFNRTPTSVQAGRVYKYRYDRDLVLEDADDCFPFNDKAFRGLVEAAAQRYKFNRHLEFSEGAYRSGLAKAARTIRGIPARRTYGKGSYRTNITDPFDDTVVQG